MVILKRTRGYGALKHSLYSTVVSFPTFQLSVVNQGNQTENSIHKQFICFTFLAVLSIMMKSPAILLHPTRGVNHPFVQRIHAIDTSLVVAIWLNGITVLVFKWLLFYLITAPKRKSSDVGNSDLPNRSRKVLPLSEKVKVLDLTGKENDMLRLLRFIIGMNLLSVKL